MKSTDRGFSIESLVGTALTLLILLINPEEPRWRIIILVSASLAFLIAVGKSQWARRTSPILTLNGEFFPDDDDSFLRKLPAYTFVLLAITIFGFATWPSKDFGVPGDAVILTGPVTSPIQYHPTPKGILPNEPGVQPGAEIKGPVAGVIGAPVKTVKPPALHPAAPTNVTAIVQ
jgi:hypothetical protein